MILKKQRPQCKKYLKRLKLEEGADSSSHWLASLVKADAKISQWRQLVIDSMAASFGKEPVGAVSENEVKDLNFKIGQN